jgi:hypothetical protein
MSTRNPKITANATVFNIDMISKTTAQALAFMRMDMWDNTMGTAKNNRVNQPDVTKAGKKNNR